MTIIPPKKKNDPSFLKMAINKFQPIISEVYFHTIDLTTEALRRYLQKIEKTKYKHNVSFELKKRWQERLHYLLYSISGIWSRFQEYNKPEEYVAQYIANFSSGEKFSLFPLICKISWNMTKKFEKNQNISGFKSWIWNCLVSQMKNEDYFQKAHTIGYKNKCCPYRIQQYVNLKNQFKHNKNAFSRHELIMGVNFSIYKKFKNNTVLIVKKTNQSIAKHTHGSESLGSEYDREIDSQIVDEKKEAPVSNFILCVANKVYRRSEKWKVLLRDGILHVNGKDLVFNSCKCEFFW